MRTARHWNFTMSSAGLHLKASRRYFGGAAGWTDWHNSDWYQLGIDNLVAASRVLQNFNFVPESQKTVTDKLTELRAMCAFRRRNGFAKAPTVHDSYLVGMALLPLTMNLPIQLRKTKTFSVAKSNGVVTGGKNRGLPCTISQIDEQSGILLHSQRFLTSQIQTRDWWRGTEKIKCAFQPSGMILFRN